MGLPLLVIAFPLAALLIGRWWVPILSGITMIGLAILLVAYEGWEGIDWGEVGLAWNLLLATLTVAGSMIGVSLNRLAREFLKDRTPA